VRRLIAVARTDLRRRLRSRSTVVLLLATAALGLIAGVDGFELAFRPGDEIHYVGEPTAAVVGLEVGVASAYLTVLVGYFLLRGRLSTDHRLGVTRVTATTPLSDPAYLLGKWLSHVAVVGLALVGLAATATVTHAQSGVGGVAPLAVLGPVLLFGLPAGGLVAGVTLLFESTERLSGTLGSIAYLGIFLALAALDVPTHASAPATPPLPAAAGDLYGTVAAGQATADALATTAPAYADGSPGLFSQFLGLPTGPTQTFDYRGGGLPTWTFLQRAGLLVVGAGLALVATLPHDRWRPVTDDERHGLVPRLRGVVPTLTLGGSDGASDAAADATPRVTQRRPASVWRLFEHELRGKLRGRPWWWYAGAVAIVVAAVGASPPRRQFVAVATAWPVFVWSSLGIRATHRSRAALVHSSPAAARQLFAEWAVGVCVAAVVCLPAVLVGGVDPTGTASIASLGGVVTDGRLLAAVAVLVFPASVALASGVLTGTPRVFEGGYLVLWYVGPLNVVSLDFAGASTTALSTAAPAPFVAVAAVALVAAVAGKRVHAG